MPTDYDVAKQTNKHMLISIVAGAIAFVIGGYFLWPVVEKSLATGSAVVSWFGMASTLVLLGFLMFAVMSPILKKQNVKMDYAHKGYDVDWSLQPNKWFGSHEREVKRTDTLGFQGVAVGGVGAMARADRLDRRERKQREMDCEVCGNQVGGLDKSAAYFVEHRKAFYILGFPFRRRITEVEAYCENHKPREWDDEQ